MAKWRFPKKYITILLGEIFLLLLTLIQKDFFIVNALFAFVLFWIFWSVISTIWMNKFPRILGLISAAIAFTAGIVSVVPNLYDQISNLFLFISALSYALFMFIAIISIMRSVFLHDEVTSDLIVGSICLYLLIGMFFALVYGSILLITPDSFSKLSNKSLSDLIYFSFVTLTTTGFGDIVPTHPLTRLLASLEAVIGTLYMAIMVARLVGMHIMSETRKRFQKGSTLDI